MVINPVEKPAVPARLENGSAPFDDEVLRRLKQVAVLQAAGDRPSRWRPRNFRSCTAVGGKQTSAERVENDANDVVDDARSRHRMCQRVIVE